MIPTYPPGMIKTKERLTQTMEVKGRPHIRGEKRNDLGRSGSRISYRSSTMHMKEEVRVRTPISMDVLVQQTESPFTAKVLHFPLPTKFRMSQIEAFSGMKDTVDHLNTYKNQMELHGYQNPVRCRAFSITLKGSALAWFNRLPPASVSSFKELSIAFVSHFIGARTYRKPSYHLLTVKQGPQENLRS